MNPSEHQIQSAYFDWVHYMEPLDDRFKMIMAIPNGGQRHIVVASKMKKEGVRKGVWDVLIAVPSGHYSCAWLEFKASSKKKLSPEQVEFCGYAEQHGGYCMVVYNFEEAKEFTEWYLNKGKVKHGNNIS